MAALRGVDVRVIVPESSDNVVVDLASQWFIENLDGLGIRFYRYQEGFMHQKVLLVDNLLSKVGSANYDNRSFRLNFEITVLTFDETFASEVMDMLEQDFKKSVRIDSQSLHWPNIYRRGG